MDSEYIKEPRNGMIRHGPEVIKNIRKEHNLENKENRENAIAIIEEWIRKQDHFVKKDFNKGYIERCIITSKGSLELAKKQIDTMCTMKTLMPQYFQISNMRESELMSLFEKADIAILPKLTDDYYRIIIFKVKPHISTATAYDFTLFYKLLTLGAEYLKDNDYCRGFILISDYYDTNPAAILSNINLAEVQQFLPVLTAGYGCKIKAVLLVTTSKFIQGFINLLKTVLSQKLGNRIHAVSSRESIKDKVQKDVLPEDYGGPEKSIHKLCENLLTNLSEEPVQKLLKEMNNAKTDESKRKVDKFNDQYMGMSGTFRTLSLD